VRFPVPILVSHAALVALAVFATLAPSSADEAIPPPRATAAITCAHAAEPGRVRCEVEAKPPPGGAILKWADAVLVSTPPFVTPLRARVGPSDATTHEDSVWRWAIALAARTRGSGEVEARVRIVSCVRDACVPSEITVHATLVVGD
jgi:hypothetical protein